MRFFGGFGNLFKRRAPHVIKEFPPEVVDGLVKVLPNLKTGEKVNVSMKVIGFTKEGQPIVSPSIEVVKEAVNGIKKSSSEPTLSTTPIDKLVNTSNKVTAIDQGMVASGNMISRGLSVWDRLKDHFS